MNFRAFALGAAVTAAATGLIPATAMVASAATPPGMPTTTMTGTGAATANATASNKSNVNVEVVTQLPRDMYWHDHMIYDNGKAAALPAGYSYRDGGVVGPDDRFYFGQSGARDGVIVAPMRCQGGRYADKPVKANNWIGDIVDSALKACAGVYDAAYNIISTAVGTGNDVYGGSC